MLKSLAIRDLQPQLAANRRYWTGLAGAGGADDPGADLPIYRTGIAHPLMNGVLRVREVPLDDAVAEARQRLDGSGWAWWVGADSDEGTAEGLMARGAEEIMTLPIMALDLDRTATFEAPANLRFRTITDAAALYCVATLQSSSEGKPVYRRIGFETVSHYRLFALGE